MYRKECPLCGNMLDPGEKCKCQLIKKMNEIMKAGKRVHFELNQTDFEKVLIKQVTEQEVKIEDSEGREWELDMDSVEGIK